MKPTYKFQSGASVGTDFYFIQEMNGVQNSSVKDLPISLNSNPLVLGPAGRSNTKLGFSALAILPISETSSKVDRLQMGVGALAAVSNDRLFSLPFLSGSYSLLLKKNIHEETLNANREALVSYSLRNRFSIEVVATKNLSLASLFDSIWGQTYDSFSRSKFAAQAELDYKVTKDFTTYVGVSNDGDAFKSDGVQSNMSFFNENTSEIYIGLTYTL